MKYFNKKKSELNDSKIISDIEKASNMYECGEIVECAKLLKQISDELNYVVLHNIELS